MKDLNFSARTGLDSEEEILARFISTILHPFLIGPVVFLHFSLAGTERFGFGMLVWLFTFVATNVVIGTYVALMKKWGVTDSIDVPERVLRLKPFMVGSVGYIIAALILYLIEAPVVVTALMAIYAVNTIIATLINQWWKISIHGMAIGGVMVPFLFLYGGYWWLLLLLFPPIVYSRVKLKAHTPAQAISGVALAFLLTWLQMWWWL